MTPDDPTGATKQNPTLQRNCTFGSMRLEAEYAAKGQLNKQNEAGEAEERQMNQQNEAE